MTIIKLIVGFDVKITNFEINNQISKVQGV